MHEHRRLLIILGTAIVSALGCADVRTNGTSATDGGTPPPGSPVDASAVADAGEAADASLGTGGDAGAVADAGSEAGADAGADASVGTGADAGGPRTAPEPWLMFHKDETHTGLASGSGTMQASGPIVRWTYQVTAPPPLAAMTTYRWYSSFPLGDLDGDGTLEVVVTSPDLAPGAPPRVIALKDTPNEPSPVRVLWTFSTDAGPPAPHATDAGAHGADGGAHAADAGHGGGATPGWTGFDQYSAALVDADGDGLLDVVVTSKEGTVRALKGTTGAVIWEYASPYFIEAGPMIADLDGSGATQVIVPTGCRLEAMSLPPSACPSALLVFAARKSGSGTTNPPAWTVEFPYKIDSSEPAIADLDPNDGDARKALVIGTWGANLTVLWRTASGRVVSRALDVRTLDATVSPAAPAVVRSSPLIADFGRGPTAVFGWMPNDAIGTEARISAVGIAVDTRAETVAFTPRWTLSRDDWKSSPALLPRQGLPPLVVTGYGIGTTQGTGNYGLCDPPRGGIIAVDPDGRVAWEYVFQNEGNVRGSPAVADVDGDGRVDVLLTVGCYGKIYAFDGATGARKWGFQLGPRTIGTPSVGDIDGNGTLEVVVPSYDGKVYALGGTR